MRTSNFENMDRRTLGLLAAGITATCWSFLAIFIKIALNYADTYTIVWYRMISAFVLLAAWTFFSKTPSPAKIFRHPPKMLILCALCLAANYLGFMKCVELTSPANAQIFIQIGPILLALSGFFVFKEKLSNSQKMGLVICIFGFGLFFLEKYSGTTTATNDNYLTGQLWVLMAAITWALFAGLQKVLLRKYNAHNLNLFIYGVATLVFLPTVQWAALAQASLGVHLLFVFLGANTLLAYGALAVALEHLPATQVSPLITLNPLVTLFLLYVMERLAINIIPPDPISLVGYTGAALAVLGVVFIVRK